MSITMVGWWQKKKNKKKNALKQSPKKGNLDQNINDLKSDIVIPFLKILFRRYTTFLYSSTRSIRHHQSLFYFKFSSRKSQNQQKLAKKITHFTIKFRSKNLTHFRNLNSFDIENNMLPKHSQKPFSGFLANMFLFGVTKNICSAPFLDTQKLNSWRTLKANVCLFLYIYVRKFYLVRMGGGRLNNFLNAACCLGFIKCLVNFHFNWNFWKLNYFSAFRCLHL